MKSVGEMFDRFVRVEAYSDSVSSMTTTRYDVAGRRTVKIDKDMPRTLSLRTITGLLSLVAVFVEYPSRLAMRLPHEVVFVLTSQTQGFGRSRIVAIPRLGGRLQKLVPKRAMFQGFLSRLDVGCIDTYTAGLKPRNVARRWDGLRRRAQLAND